MARIKCNCNEVPFFPANVRRTDDEGWTRIISFKRGFICPDPIGHGRHGIDIIFAIQSPLVEGKVPSAAHFVVNTGWDPDWSPHKVKGHEGLYPIPMDVGYHSTNKSNPHQRKIKGCPWLNGQTCYMDLANGDVGNVPFKLLVSEGEESLWTWLKEWLQKVDTINSALTGGS